MLVLVVAILATWYGNRLRVVAAEKRRLNGKWHVVDANGGLAIVNGTPLVVDFTPGTYEIDLSREPYSIDFALPNGVSRGIYCWDGKRLRIIQGSVGVERPMAFGQSFQDIRIESAAGAGPHGLNDYYLERLPKK